MTPKRSIVAVSVASLTMAIGAGCASGGSASDRDPFDVPASSNSADADRAATVGELLETGPAYTPFDVAPVLRSGDWLTDLLSEALVPVLDARGLGADTRTLVWGLVDEAGTVRSAVVQTTSGDEAFDAAAVRVAEQLDYDPALRGDTPVPVWILINVSMLLR